jgi:hypothetical protein
LLEIRALFFQLLSIDQDAPLQRTALAGVEAGYYRYPVLIVWRGELHTRRTRLFLALSKRDVERGKWIESSHPQR